MSAVTMAAVAYGTYRAAGWIWNHWIQQPNDEQEENNKNNSSRLFARTNFNSRHMQRIRRQRLERCRDEAAKAMGDFLISIKQVIEQHTQTSREVTMLKQLAAKTTATKMSSQKQNQEEEEENDEDEEKRADLWNTIKIKTVTRMMAWAHAQTMLYLVLHVQVHLLGARLLEQQLHQEQEQQDVVDAVCLDTHRRVLSQTFHYFFKQGLGDLVQSMERSVAFALKDWNVTMDITLESFETALQTVCAAFNGKTRPRVCRPKMVLDFFLNPNEETSMQQQQQEDLVAQHVLNETWDLLESPLFVEAQNDCQNIVWDTMKERGWSKIFHQNNDNLPSSQLCEAKPLANVIAQLKHVSNTFYKRQSIDNRANIYLEPMEKLPSVIELGDVSFN